MLVVLAAAPLQVRVLSALHPVEARVEGAALECDGHALEGRLVTVSAAAEGLKVAGGPSLCARLVSREGPTTVRVGEVTRVYPDRLEVWAEPGALVFVNTVEVEAYLPSVVAMEAGEMPAAALEAQAVVARTFARASLQRHRRNGYHLCDLAHCQVYRGLDGATAASRKAVKDTAGQVLLAGGVRLVPVFFHGACGGHTSAPADVFGEQDGLPGVSDLLDGAPACREAEGFKWESTLERMRLATALGVAASGASVEPLRRDSAGRLIELRAFGRRFTAQAFTSAVGKAFGWRAVPSQRFSALEREGAITITGVGAGHGVGLCQAGAAARARAGADASSILRHYFPSATPRAWAP